MPLTPPGASGLDIDGSGRALAMSTDGADFGHVLAADRVSGGADGWRVLVPEAPPAVLRSMLLCPGREPENPRLLLVSSVDGRTLMSLHNAADGRLIADVPLPGGGTIGSIGPVDAAAEPDLLDFGYTDWTTPLRRYTLDTATGRVTRATPAPEPLPVRVTNTT